MTRRIRTAGAITIAALLVTFSVGSAAWAKGYTARVGFRPSFGFAGDVEAKTTIAGQSSKVEDDFEPTAGFSLFGEYRVMRYVAIGGMASFLWWNSEGLDAANQDPNLWIDLDFTVRGMYPLLNDKMEIYVQMPVGLTIAVPGEDKVAVGGFAGEVKTGVGVNFSIVFGLLYNVWSQLDVFLDMGVMFHWATNEVKVGNTSGDIASSGAQMAFNFGAAWRF